jgi:hypothetical protein
MNTSSQTLIFRDVNGWPNEVELPEHILRAIRIEGRYHEVEIDAASGSVLGVVTLQGFYDSYADVYSLNGQHWKVTCHLAARNGETVYTLGRAIG